ncbi:hypothetical protein [Limobrevibacterium gyesilva]|uniref:Uncharacterized protein n=1 Tax=Limobrevibacterium gyesilva TaxID=2991712 RepID=A0AA41YHJ6_9PROT|nr:hypothetical protein [Limobrevibacterium gyesilva]MCW3473466.1 hypothetical protein [Limobrevibacterium gyesilva]
MPDDRWLWDQPKLWHDINRALQDISILLQHLGQMPEARLLTYFEDTQNRMADSASKNTVPPCASYPEFLNCLFQIASAFQTGRRDQLPANPPGRPDGMAPLDPVCFVYWSRDFLPAVAAPATADSIRVTQDYMIRRARICRCRRWLGGVRRTRPDPAPAMPPLPPDPDEPTREMLARKLAHWARGFEWLTVGVVLLTVMVSIYALSGRLILGNEHDMADKWAKLDAQLELQEDKLFSAPTQVASVDAHRMVIGLCDYVGTEKVQAPTWIAEAGTANTRTDASGSGGETAVFRKVYVSARQAHLCDEREKVLRDLFIVTMHLQNWSSAVTQRIGEGWTVHFGNVAVPLAIPLAPLFGVVPATLTDYAADGHGALCKQAASDIYDPATGEDGCKRILWTFINRSRNVAESILGSITQYILPVFYGFLGAMAATLRMLRRKVDASLLSYTDRARLQQSAILGVLCGGVIGLFASYIGKADAAGGLGLSAVALLAGYNVDGVFRFLDELSDRIFRPTTAGKP